VRKFISQRLSDAKSLFLEGARIGRVRSGGLQALVFSFGRQRQVGQVKSW
jgi:hypothetical protein